jgi:ubiquinone/menaquinone biosynthesis C-methylase UbiE
MTTDGIMAHDRELFAGTAYYYARYRPPYPAELFGCLAAEYGLEGGSQVLDLGCGTGQLALPLARAGCTVWAMDPDPDMIGEGVRAQARAEHGNVRWLLGRAEDLRSAGLPAVRLCTMGAAFHWMDRDLVLRSLDQVIEPGGGVALASGAASIWSVSDAVQGAWLDVTRDVVRQFLGPERRAGRGTYSHPARGHEDVLRDSAFSQVRTRRFTSARLLSVEEVVGQQLSTSYASPAQLGDRLPGFRAELSRRLLELSPAGEFETVEHTDVIMARRGPAGSDRP